MVLLAGRVTGWWLATAPLVTYTLVAVMANLDELSGWRFGWNFAVLLIATTVVGAAMAVICFRPWKWVRSGRAHTRGPRESLTTMWREAKQWLRREIWPVSACVAGVILIVVTVLAGVGDLSRPHQDYDTVFHLSAIDVIHDYQSVNHKKLQQDLGVGEEVFYYPLGWHALAAVLQGLTGANTASVMNASLLAAAMPAVVGMCAFVRLFDGSRWLSGLTALAVAVGIGFPFDVIRHGPLTGFLCGLSLIPALLVAFLLALHGSVGGVPLRILVVGGGLGALVFIHPGAAALAAVCAAVFMVQLACAHRLRWWKRGLAVFVPAAVLAIALTVLPMMHTRDVMKSIHGLMNWPEFVSVQGAILNLTSGQTFSYDRQYGIAALTCLGLLVTLQRWRQWLWLIFLLGIVGTLYVTAAAIPGHNAALITSWWWNDARRLLSCFAMLSSVVLAIAIAALANLLRGIPEQGRKTLQLPHTTARVLAVLVALVPVAVHSLVLSAQLTGEHYRSETRLSATDRVSWLQVRQQLGPQAKILNDPGDGSAYARSLADVNVVGQRNIGPVSYGTHSSLVQGQFDDQHTALWRNFREIATNADVRQHVQDAGITHVILGQSQVGTSTRPIGLMGLTESQHLEQLPDIGSLQVWRVALEDKD